MAKIVGNNDGPGGRNKTYRIGSRKEVPRRTAVKEVKQGKHPGAHVVKVNGREYIRDSPSRFVERDAKSGKFFTSASAKKSIRSVKGTTARRQ